MIKAKALLLVLACLAAFTVSATAGSADAAPGGGCQLCGQGPPPVDKPPPPPPDSSTGHATVRNCSLYANPSNFGYACIGGGHVGDIRTVKDVLHGDDLPTCWDERIPDDVLLADYGVEPDPQSPHYVHSCITGLDPNKSVYYQPDAQLSQIVIGIPINAPNCPRPYKDAMFGRCVATLTQHQQEVVQSTDVDHADIPGITVVTSPSSKIRTHVDTAYADKPVDDVTQQPIEHPTEIDETDGGVHLWAVMTEYKLFPYGPGGGHVVSCKVQPEQGLHDDPAGQITEPPCNSRHPALHWTYPTSSAHQPDQVYPLRVQANWTVFYTDAAGQTRRLATFEKYNDTKLPVYDVQAIVVH